MKVSFFLRLLVAVVTASLLAACAPIKEVTLIGEPAKLLEQRSPASVRVLKLRQGGADLDDPVRLTTVTDWCEIKPDGQSCDWRTMVQATNFDPFARAFLLTFVGGGFVGLTQLSGVTYAAKKAACQVGSFCGGTMVVNNNDGATAVSGSTSNAVAASDQTQHTSIGSILPKP